MPRPDLLPADLADDRIQELENDIADLRAENKRLRSKLMPMHFITAPEAINYLKDLALRLDSAHERRSVEITILAIRRLLNDESKTAWWQPQSQEGKP